MHRDVFWSQCGTKDEHDFCEKLNEVYAQNVLDSLAHTVCITSGYSLKLHTVAETLCQGWTLPSETLL